MADNNSTTINSSELCQMLDPSPEVIKTYQFSNGRSFYEKGKEPRLDLVEPGK